MSDIRKLLHWGEPLVSELLNRGKPGLAFKVAMVLEFARAGEVDVMRERLSELEVLLMEYQGGARP